MKQLGITLIFYFIIHSGFSQSSVLDRIITIRFDSTRVEKALELLERESGASFAFSTDMPALQETVHAQFTGTPLRTILNSICAGRNLSYQLIGRTVTFYPREKIKYKKLTISGFIFDGITGEALIACSVYDKATGQGTSSNSYGFFSLTLPKGQRSITFSFVGYEPQVIAVHDDTVMNLKLSPALPAKLNEVIIIAKHDEDFIESSGMGKIEIRSKRIKYIPATVGEVDVLKAITLLPGVMPGVDGSAGYYVRGGSADQNLILLDGIPIYNPYHLWGFLSTFNANAINHINIVKGAFPARYGGRSSSVLDIVMNEGNTQKWITDLAIGILSANVTVSGPLKKDRSSLMFSARRTYADLFIVPITTLRNATENTSRTQGYNFTDLNLKINHKLSDKDRFYVSGFFSRDQYYLTETSTTTWNRIDYDEQLKQRQGWGGVIGSFRWNHLISNKLFSNTTAYLSYYSFKTRESYERTRADENEVDRKVNDNTYISNIRDIAITQGYQLFPNQNHEIRFGGGYIYHTFKPGVNSFFSRTGQDTISNNIDNNLIRASELNVYFEDDMDIGLRFRLNLGIHASGFFVGHFNYFSVQPRISARYLATEKVSLKAGYSRMTQYLHLLTSSAIVQSSDLWVPTTDKIKPEDSRQVSLGVAAIVGKGLDLEIEGYYKTMNNVIEYKEGASYLYADAGWEEQVTAGKGKSYGVEWLLKKNRGRLTGWIGYTLSWSDRQFDEINSGKVFPFRYDRRHNISIVGSYQVSAHWSLNGTWVFYTGNAVTVPTIAHTDPYYDGEFHTWSSFPSPNASTTGNISSSGIIDLSPARNNYRLPNYHRLDFTASYLKNKPWGTWELTFGVTNLYNRMNPSYYTKSYEENPDTGKITFKYKQVTLFPIMPSIYYRVSF